MTKSISKAEYVKAFDYDLSEVCELFLRHAYIYVETTAFTRYDDNDVATGFYMSAVSRTYNRDIGRIACNGLNDDRAIQIEYYYHASMAEVHQFYFNTMSKYQSAEVDV